MTRHETYEQKTEALLNPILDKNGYEEVDVEFVKEAGNYYLRAYIDKPGGITLDDCESVSRELSDALDEEDFIEESYILEVSSPGLGRPLKKEKDYARSLGEMVEIHTYHPINRKKQFTGVLKAYDDSSVTIEEENGSDRVFAKNDISLIRQAVIW